MTINVNTNVFTIVEDKDRTYVDLSMEFDEMANILNAVMRKWNEVQCRHNGFLAADETSAGRLNAMADLLRAMSEKAVENKDMTYKRMWR